MALVTDGQPRGNPFEAFGSSPSAIKRPPVAGATKAVRQLVATVQRSQDIGKATTEAARTVEKAAKAVEQALAAVKKAREGVRDARRVRDTVGETWESALAALKRLASVVAEEGAPDLYVKLFPPVSRAAPKARTAGSEAPAETPAQEPPAQPAAQTAA